MKAHNDKVFSVNLKMKVFLQRSRHTSWLKWFELALTIAAITAHIISWWHR